MNMLRIVILSLICILICCAFAGDSYQESKPGKEKHKSEVSSSYVYFYLSQPERMSTFGWLGISFNKYLETDGIIVINKKVLLL